LGIDSTPTSPNPKPESGSTWPSGSGDARRDCGTVLTDAGIAPEAYCFGRTKVFLKSPATLFGLEAVRERKLHEVARLLQAGYRSYRAHKYLLELREKSLGIFCGRRVITTCLNKGYSLQRPAQPVCSQPGHINTRRSLGTPSARQEASSWLVVTPLPGRLHPPQRLRAG